MDIKQFLAVFVGGGLGSLVRFGIGKYLNTVINTSLPIATLITNVVACFVLGIILGVSKPPLNPIVQLFWGIGFCGGFSTFSTFSNEILQKINDNELIIALLYISLSLFLGVLSVILGNLLAKNCF